MNAKRTSSDPTTITATIGKTGDTTRIVYTKGYYFDPGINNWAEYFSTCTGTLNGDWHRKLSVLVRRPRERDDHRSGPLDHLRRHSRLLRRHGLLRPGRRVEMRVSGYDVLKFLLANSGGGSLNFYCLPALTSSKTMQAGMVQGAGL